MFRKVCGVFGTLMAMASLVIGAFFPQWLWGFVPAIVLMIVSCVRMTDDE